MATIKEITTLCRDGKTQEAYELAKADLELAPNDLWKQREMGWPLYYCIKDDTEAANFQRLITHLDELRALNLLSIPQDNMLFEAVLFKLGTFVKYHILPKANGAPAKLSALFDRLRQYSFEPSDGYSYFLNCMIKCSAWPQLADFLDWWDLGKLTQKDYQPFKTEEGKTIMSVAEQAYIAKSKVLLQLNDRRRIEAFLPQLDALIEAHPKMTYPGYFYGKLLLSLGNSTEEALDVVLPFARKKANEFWVWQLLSDLFNNDPEKQLACLLKAVNCGAQEKYLGKVRVKLATLFVKRNMLDYAKYQIDKVTACYLQQGWPLPYEVDCWVHQDWIKKVAANAGAPIDFISITSDILLKDAKNAIAVVINVDKVKNMTLLLYGKKQSMSMRLRFKVKMGDLLKISYATNPDGSAILLKAEKVDLMPNLDYVRMMEGEVSKHADLPYAFLRAKKYSCFIPPSIVNRYHLQDGESIIGLFAYLYNRKREKWGWSCVKIV